MIVRKSVFEQYLIKRLKEVDLDKAVLYNKEEYKKFKIETGSDCSFESYKRTVRDVYSNLINIIEDDEIISDSLEKTQAAKQGLQDRNTVVNKINRESNRLYNHLKELYEEYVKTMKEYGADLKVCKLKSEKVEDNKSWGILHLADWHGNKKIEKKEDIENEYNFSILSQRFKKYITEAIFYLKAKNIKNVLVVSTGDLITSDYRESQKLTKITNSVKATLLVSYIIKQGLLELNQHFGLRICGVSGNESRIDDFMDSIEIMSSNNYDYLILNNLRLWLEGNTNIQFDMNGNSREKYLTIANGFNIVLLHGDTFKGRETGKQVKDIMTKYAMRGRKVNCILAGHIHSTSISDIFSRSSSLIGADPYPATTLHLFDGKPAANVYLVNDEDNTYDAIKIDLSSSSKYKGYDIKKELEIYHIEENFSPNTEVIIRNFC